MILIANSLQHKELAISLKYQVYAISSKTTIDDTPFRAYNKTKEYEKWWFHTDS